MRQSAYERARDQYVADEPEHNVDRALMCPAAGCPNRWSVSGDRGRGCSAHYWADPREWPRITQALVDAETDRARYAAAARPPPAEPPTTEMRKAAVAALQAFVDDRHRDPRAWARELQRRHERGERLPDVKVAAYREALRLDACEREVMS
jgi:hypothetical protein